MGKGGGGGGHTPQEDKDTIESSQMISIIDLWSEGQIVGLEDGLKSVYMDNTPVMAQDGTVNIPGVSVQSNVGTEDQDYLDGFPQSAAEISVGVQVKQSDPVIRTITDNKIDMIRINLYSRGLYLITKDGDTKRTDLKMRIEVRPQGSTNWEEKARIDFINQKSKNEFSFKAELWDLPPAPFDVRVVRETSDEESGDWQQIQNSSYWRSYSAVVNQKYRWPLTAYCGIKFDSKTFENAIPRRNYILKGSIVKVPSNYDPETRKYNGFWNYEFKAAYTNNPVWIAYDLIKNTVYGLGRKNIDVDEAEMYLAAQWCDEFIPDGKGGTEPRMTCNCYITEQRQAWDLLTDIMSCFRAMPIWDGQRFAPSVDMPRDPKASYNNSNVIDGMFKYSASSKEDRHSVIQVRFANKEKNFEQDTIQIVDDEMVERYGWNMLSVESFGADTESQAYRYGLYILETEKLERKTVSFQTGAEGLRNLPGDIITVADSYHQGAIIGGRILSISEDRKEIELDDYVEIPTNSEVYVTLIGDERAPVELLHVGDTGRVNRLKFSTTCPDSLGRLSPWSLKINNLGLKLYRCMSISENGDSTYSITAIEHYPEKNSVIDNGVVFNPPDDGMYPRKIPPVENLKVEATPESEYGQARIYWDAPATARQIDYNVKIVRSGAVVINRKTSDSFMYINPDVVGTYQITVRGVGSDGELGEPVQAVFVIADPAKPASVSWTSSNFTITLKPVPGGFPTLGEIYEWFFGSTEQEVLDQTYNLGLAYTLNQVGLKPNTEYWFGVRAVNNIGRSDILTVKAKTDFETDSLEGLIDVALPNTDYIKEINKNIDGLEQLASLRVVDKNGNRPRVTGIYLNAGDAGKDVASVVDVVADVFSISSPDTLERWVYFDSTNRRLILGGEIQAVAGRLQNVVIEENCVIKGKLSVANIEGYTMEGNQYQFNLFNTGANRTIRYNGNAMIPVRLYGQIIATQRYQSKTTITVNGRVNNGTQIAQLGEATARQYVYLYTFSQALNVGQSMDIKIDAGALDQGRNENTDYSVLLWVAPQSNGFVFPA